jgi:ribosomal protein S18 acetylase RimI-like enzyme
VETIRDDGGDGIRHSVGTPAEVPELIGLLSRTFATNDPPAVAVGLTPDELETYLAAYSAMACRGLTIVARNGRSGEMAGALLTLDAAADPGPADGLSPKFSPIMNIFSHLEGPLTSAPEPAPGEVLSLLMLGVADAYAGRGIAQELVRQCLANGAQGGYRRALTTATNPVSQHIFRKLGFNTLATTSYGDYRWNGVAPFASIAHQGGPMRMARELDR